MLSPDDRFTPCQGREAGHGIAHGPLVEAIRARCEAATPGPWEVDKAPHERFAIHYWIRTVTKIVERHGASPCERSIAWLCGSLGEHLGWKEPKEYRDDPAIHADATFLAHARRDIPFLLTECDKIIAELAEARARIAELEEQLGKKA